MATTSFFKDFVVTDTKSIQQLQNDLQFLQVVAIKSRNHENDKIKSINLLKQRLLTLTTC